jgi:deoxyribonuclease-4
MAKKHLIGSHIDDIENIPNKSNIVQLFKDNKILDKTNKNIVKNKVIHASYIINLANNWDEYSWWIDLFINEILYAAEIDAMYIVVHLGKQLKLSKKEALNNMFTSLLYVHDETKKKANNVKILLETSSGQGSETCFLLEDLAYFYKKISTHKNTQFKNRFGICLDTCHVFAAGYDITSSKNIKYFLNKFNKIIGIDHIKLVHLNDSKNSLGSMIDRHANIGTGHIGKKSLLCITKFFIKKNIPIILETPAKHHNEEIQFLRTIID